MDHCRTGRSALVEALRGCPEDARIPSYGPTMAPTSMATARMMETWAHADDVARALGIDVPRTDRARHVAFLGVRTRDFAHQVNGLKPSPSSPLARLRNAGSASRRRSPGHPAQFPVAGDPMAAGAAANMSIAKFSLGPPKSY